MRFEIPNIHLTKKVDYIDELGYTTETHITYTPCYTQYGLIKYNVCLKLKNMMEIKYKKETFERLLKSFGYENIIISETPLLRYDGNKICNDDENYPVIELHWVTIPNGDLKKFLDQYKHHKIILLLHEDFMEDNKIKMFFL